MTRRLTASQKSINRSRRAQQAQISRINKMVESLRRQGYELSQKFLNKLQVTGKTASSAARKAQSLKDIKMKDVREAVKSYRTDDGKILRGSRAREEGPRIERAKKRQARKARVTMIENIEDDISNAVDELWIKNDGTHVRPGEQVDVSDLKNQLADAWSDYRTDTKVNNMDIDMLNQLHETLTALNDHSMTRSYYDGIVQAALSLLTGGPVDPDMIGNDEAMEDIS